MSAECFHTVETNSLVCRQHKTCRCCCWLYSSALLTICPSPPPFPHGPASVCYWLTCVPAMIPSDQSRVAVKCFWEGLHRDVMVCGRSLDRPRSRVAAAEYCCEPLPDQVSCRDLPDIRHSNAWTLTALAYLHKHCYSHAEQSAHLRGGFVYTHSFCRKYSLKPVICTHRRIRWMMITAYVISVFEMKECLQSLQLLLVFHNKQTFLLKKLRPSKGQLSTSLLLRSGTQIWQVHFASCMLRACRISL